MKKKILLGLLAILVVIQFIKPERNLGEIEGPNHIKNVINYPEDVAEIMTRACFDCHSNKTNYPWYANVQPVAWFLDSHVREGKEHLNFSEFKTYPGKKQAHKLEEVVESMKEGWMPLHSYIWIHKEADLTDAERIKIADWAQQSMTAIVQ